MQKLPSTVQTDSRKLVEGLYDFPGTINSRRGDRRVQAMEESPPFHGEKSKRV